MVKAERAPGCSLRLCTDDRPASKTPGNRVKILTFLCAILVGNHRGNVRAEHLQYKRAWTFVRAVVRRVLRKGFTAVRAGVDAVMMRATWEGIGGGRT